MWVITRKNMLMKGGQVNRPGPSIERRTLIVFGKYLDDALTLANMSQAELARRAGLRSSSVISHVMRGERTVGRETQLKWCRVLQCPEWLEECMLIAAGYATERQMQAYNNEAAAEEAHQKVLEAVQQRKRSE
jgi:transcriptional regulator with XRE-family HTH domain